MDKATCEYCGETYRVVDPNSPEYGSNWGWQSDLSKVTISFEADPFDEEIYHDSTKHWLCSNCSYNSYLEV